MAAVGPLPPGWEAKWLPSYNRFVYMNHVTKVTSWEPPKQADGSGPPAPSGAPAAKAQAVPPATRVASAKRPAQASAAKPLGATSEDSPDKPVETPQAKPAAKASAPFTPQLRIPVGRNYAAPQSAQPPGSHPAPPNPGHGLTSGTRLDDSVSIAINELVGLGILDRQSIVANNMVPALARVPVDAALQALAKVRTYRGTIPREDFVIFTAQGLAAGDGAHGPQPSQAPPASSQGREPPVRPGSAYYQPPSTTTNAAFTAPQRGRPSGLPQNQTPADTGAPDEEQKPVNRAGPGLHATGPSWSDASPAPGKGKGKGKGKGAAFKKPPPPAPSNLETAIQQLVQKGILTTTDAEILSKGLQLAPEATALEAITRFSTGSSGRRPQGNAVDQIFDIAKEIQQASVPQGVAVRGAAAGTSYMAPPPAQRPVPPVRSNAMASHPPPAYVEPPQPSKAAMQREPRSTAPLGRRPAYQQPPPSHKPPPAHSNDSPRHVHSDRLPPYRPSTAPKGLRRGGRGNGFDDEQPPPYSAKPFSPAASDLPPPYEDAQTLPDANDPPPPYNAAQQYPDFDDAPPPYETSLHYSEYRPSDRDLPPPKRQRTKRNPPPPFSPIQPLKPFNRSSIGQHGALNLRHLSPEAQRAIMGLLDDGILSDELITDELIELCASASPEIVVKAANTTRRFSDGQNTWAASYLRRLLKSEVVKGPDTRRPLMFEIQGRLDELLDNGIISREAEGIITDHLQAVGFARAREALIDVQEQIDQLDDPTGYLLELLESMARPQHPPVLSSRRARKPRWQTRGYDRRTKTWGPPPYSAECTESSLPPGAKPTQVLKPRHSQDPDED